MRYHIAAALDSCVRWRFLLLIGMVLLNCAACEHGKRAMNGRQAAVTNSVMSVTRPYLKESAAKGRRDKKRDDLTALVERVTLFFDILSRAGSGTGGAVDADEFARLLAQLDNASAVQKACEAVLGRLVDDDDKLAAILNDLLNRPLTSWQVNTVHQMIAMIEVRQRKYHDAVHRINTLLGPDPDIHTPKLTELLIVQGNAYRGLNDRSAYEAVLQRIVDIATQLGAPYAAQKKAELARLRGEPWEHLDPVYAAEVQCRVAVQQRQEQEQLDFLQRLPYEQRRHAAALVETKMRGQLASTQLSTSQRHTLSAAYTRLLHVLNQPD